MNMQLHPVPPIRFPATVAPADVPVVMLPVGLETRFSGDSLLIRIIPDEIHVEDHEPELTDAEAEAGRAFWTDVWHGGTAEPAATDHERNAWTRLVVAVGASRRAAWIADQLTPTGGTRPADALPPDAPLPDPPVFPTPPSRAGVWSRPAVARSLPDQFLAIAYQATGSGGQVTYREIGRAFGAPVADTIQLGLDPSAPAPTVTDTGPLLPEGMQWLIDPDKAQNAGLLIQLPLPAGTTRIDRLIVLGVLSSADAGTSAGRLANLLAGHHYSQGLSVLPIGTPSNNTQAERSGFSKPDDPVASFGVERRTAAPADGTDGALLARALGVANDVFRGIEHSGDAEQTAAQQMNTLIWPASIGYWLETLVQPGPGDAFISQLRDHAIRMVRGRGPLPPLRVGQQPYGVLPVTSLAGWQAGSEPAAVSRLVDFARLVLPWWLDGVSRAPAVRAGANPDQATLDMLGQAAVSSSVAVRSMLGANASFIPTPLVGDGPGAEANRQRWMALLAFRALGVTGLPYLGELVAQTADAPLLELPYTVDPRRKPVDAAADWSGVTSYLRSLRSTTTDALQKQNPVSQTSVLTLLARRAVLLDRLRVGTRDTNGVVAGTLVEAHVRIDDPVVVQAQLLSTSATVRIGDAHSAASALLAGAIQQADGSSLTMLDHLDRSLVLNPIDIVRNGDYAQTIAAAEAVAALAPDRAAFLLGESLDIASHRLDAWITSLATRRLWDLRAQKPTGATLAAYGAVEDLTRGATRPVVDQPPPGTPTPLHGDPAGGGFVHAASMAQAATAAVLRAGFLAHSALDPDAGAFAIDLSSSRVRIGLELLEGVREGQSLGALLGYRVERFLHEAGAHTSVEVMRRLAPPPVVTAAGTPEGLRPSAVCDGLALSRMDRSTIVSAVQQVDATGVAAVNAALDMLVDAADSVADLLLAESVHQIVRGNPERAAGALDSLNRGEGGMAEPEVVSTPRTGTSLTHRTLVLVGDIPPAAPGWPIDGIRARVEPRLAAWVGHLLGDPTGVVIKVTAPAAQIELSLVDLGVGALDVVYEPLGTRALRHARAQGLPEFATADLSAPEIASLLARAEALHDLLTRARPATGLDLARPQDRGGIVQGPPPLEGSPAESQFTTTLSDVDVGDMRGRLDQARVSLQNAIGALGPDAPESSLLGSLDVLAGFGLSPGGDPSQTVSSATLTQLRDTAQALLDASTARLDDPNVLFGAGFLVLPLVTPPRPDTLVAALASDPLASTAPEALAPLGGGAVALDTWIENYGRVRPAVGRLADVLLAARLHGTARSAQLAMRCFQLPAQPFPSAPPERRASWVGLPFPSALGLDPVTSFVAQVLGTLDPGAGVSGVVVDEFTETIPSLETTTAISFGFDAPGARPPQSILLAVPAVPGAAWTINSLAQVIGETLDLAKIRMVDLSAMAWAGRLVPAIYLTDGDIASGVDTPMKNILQVAHAQSLMLDHQ
jgi:hypothetical protein